MTIASKSGPLGLLDTPLFNSTAFDTDRLHRAWAATLLAERIQLLGGGCVLCLDAPWGEGKTFFVKNWQKMLDDSGTKTIYIDAFSRDYVDDPFLVIAAAIRGHLKSAENGATVVAEHFNEAAKRVSLALLPTATKMLVNGIGLALGAPAIGGAVADAISNAAEGAEKVAERVVEERLEELEQAESSVENLKAALAQYVETLSSPLVIVIDELDRCSPLFAVRLLERIKHYFELPGIVFVLSAHKAQLQAAVSGVYGQIDAAGYLNKFIHVTFHLPKKEQERYARSTDIYAVIYPVMSKLNVDKEFRTDSSEVLASIATDLGMSIRDAQRAMLSVSLSNVTHKLIFMTAYLSCLRVSRPAIYSALKLRHKSRHEMSLSLIDSLGDTRSGHLLSLLRYIHKDALDRATSDETDQQAKKWVENLSWSFSFHKPSDLLDFCFSGLDLTQS